MSRKNYLFQETVNTLLNKIKQEMSVGERFPSDVTLAQQFDISRSTVRKALLHLEEIAVIAKHEGKRVVASLPTSKQFFVIEDTVIPKGKQVEEHFMHLILNGKIKPGDRFSELELARQSDCNTVAVREFLIRFSHFGLIEKKPRSQWQMKTFDEPFVDQLYEVRHLFEMHSLSKFMQLPEDSVHWQTLEALLAEHKVLSAEMDTRYQDFSDLDKKLHLLLQVAHPNQFISQFYDIISFVFHYHYQWDKSDEKARNAVAVEEHIDIISKMLMKDLRGAIISLESHLNTAKSSLKKTAILK